MMRSCLFVPADNLRKLEKSLSSSADALIFDLEDAVAADRKLVARAMLADFLRVKRHSCGKAVFVRVNELGSGMTLDDMAAVMPFRPDGIVLPKCRGGRDVQTLDLYLSAFETIYPDRSEVTRIVAIITETAQSVLGAHSYRDVSHRLSGLMWGAEDLAADLGAMRQRADGHWTAAFALARSMCLLAAANAGVDAIDAVSTEIANTEALLRETREARCDGFAAKAAIHPGQIDSIHQALAPSEEERSWAERVVAAFSSGSGVATLDGKMLDRPHLRLAHRLLQQTGMTITSE
jgi:citrate lyase subunit beta/citryl-CoA lyase